MKKLLLSAFAALACVAAASADEIVLDFTTNQYGQKVGSADKGNENYLVSNDEPTYTFIADGVEITAEKLEGSGVRFFSGTGGSAGITFRINAKSGFSVAVPNAVISQIVIDGNTDCNSLTTTDGEYSNKTFVGSSAKVSFVNTGKTAQIKTMTITYEVGGAVDDRKSADLAFSEDKVTVNLGEEFTAPTLTHATNAAITYSSDKEEVATVDAATGVVTIVGEGTARITAKAEANDEYRAGSASYLLTVLPAKVVVAGAIFTSEMGEGFSFENPDNIEVWVLDSKYGLKASAYKDGTTIAADAIAYTTNAIDLTTYEKATLTFQQAINQFKINDELIDVDAVPDYLSIVVREEGATEWEVIGEPNAPEAFSWTFYDNEPIDLTDYCGKKIQFGFKYHSTSTCAGTWEIKNINVAAEGENAISEISAAKNAGVIYDLQGRRVVAPARGLYIVNGKVVRF